MAAEAADTVTDQSQTEQTAAAAGEAGQVPTLGTIIKLVFRKESVFQVLEALVPLVKVLLGVEVIRTLTMTSLVAAAAVALASQEQMAVKQPLVVEVTVFNLALLAPALTMAVVAVAYQKETAQLVAVLAAAVTQMLQALRILAVVAEQKQLEAPALLS